MQSLEVSEVPKEPQVIGAITAEESAMFGITADPEADPVVADIFKQRFMGHVVGEEGKAYALVTVPDQESGLKASHYVYLGKNDFGTIINPKSAEQKGLPKPEDSLASMHDSSLPPIRKPEISSQGEGLNVLSGEAKRFHDILSLPENDINAALSSLSIESETESSPRLLELFAPRLTRDEAPKVEVKSQADKYQRIAQGLETYKVYKSDAVSENKDPYLKDEPTHEEKKQAIDRLREAEHDPIIRAILNKHAKSKFGTELIDFIRKDADLRYELGSYLLRDKIPALRLSDPHALPERVYLGTKKSPSHKGYGRYNDLKGDEYVVMLALSMIDGTYQKTGTYDGIKYKDDGSVEYGMHRVGAAALLGTSTGSRKYIESTLVIEDK